MSGNVHFWRGVYDAAEYCAESIYTEIGVIPRLTIIGTGGEHTLLPCFDAERGLSASVLTAIRAYMIWVNASCFFFIYADEACRGYCHIIAASRDECVWLRKSFDDDSRVLGLPQLSSRIPEELSGLLPARHLQVTAEEFALINAIDRGDYFSNLLMPDRKRFAGNPCRSGVS